MKVPTGFYKSQYMTLTNQELYFKADRTSEEPARVIILSPGVFVKELPAEEMTSSQPSQSIKVYPIELYIGG